MKIAVVGATGLVGEELIRGLATRNFKIDVLLPVASEISVGSSVIFEDKAITVISMEEAIAAKPDLALFSAGGQVSLEYAPRFVENGTLVIDNSSAWRMDPTKKLIIPEVNGHALRIDDRIIANPNCSTIQMVLALYPLHAAFGIQRLVVSTYQSVTGTGKAALQQLEEEIRNGKAANPVYPHTIHQNALPHVDVFMDNGYTKEEMKMVNETRKILDDAAMAITATCVRLPILGGHSESLNIEFDKDFDLDEVYRLLQEAPGIKIEDNPAQNSYPMPITAHGTDDVYVGRIRRDESHPKALNMWVVADNLRKGAATNALQIAEYLIDHSLLY